MIFQAPQDIPDGVYDAALLSVEPQAPMNPIESPYVRWVFQLSVNDKMVQLSTSTSLNMGPKSDTRRVLESLRGRPMQPREAINMDNDLLPWLCQVVVKTDPEFGYSRIIDVLEEKVLLQADEDKALDLMDRLYKSSCN